MPYGVKHPLKLLADIQKQQSRVDAPNTRNAYAAILGSSARLGQRFPIGHGWTSDRLVYPGWLIVFAAFIPYTAASDPNVIGYLQEIARPELDDARTAMMSIYLLQPEEDSYKNRAGHAISYLHAACPDGFELTSIIDVLKKLPSFAELTRNDPAWTNINRRPLPASRSVSNQLDP